MQKFKKSLEGYVHDRCMHMWVTQCDTVSGDASFVWLSNKMRLLGLLTYAVYRLTPFIVGQEPCQ